MTGSIVEYGVSISTRPGETECGDVHIVRPTADGVIVAVLDGLGHGQEAAVAARTGVERLREADEATVGDLLRQCHEALRATRGVVMSLAWFRASDNSLTWLGVGNVEGRLLRAGASELTPPVQLMLHPGLVGHRLPPLQPSVLPLARGDTLLLATDGIDPGFDNAIRPGSPPQESAGRIMAQHYKGTDDALVMVVRYLGTR